MKFADSLLPMADASDMPALEHSPAGRMKAGKAPNPSLGVDARTVESAVVMKPKVLETVAAAKRMKDRGRAVA
jgi:hypothetical protein